MLAAGVGQRLFGGDDAMPPKVLLEFDGMSLLERHIAILKSLGIQEMVLVVGYRQEELRTAVERLGASGFVRFIENAEFRRGPILSLWTARDSLANGDAIFMDADVLYPATLMERLTTRPGSAFLMDRDYEPGLEPVKLCLKDGRIVEFRKKLDPALAFDVAGEWPGFAKFVPSEGVKLIEAMRAYIERGEIDLPYEEPMRDIMLADPSAFAVEDVTGLPWVEIDFPEDLERARTSILPEILKIERKRLPVNAL
jgi:choline kinase